MHYDPEKITFFAKTDARGQNVSFGIKAKDRTKHMYVIGKTGMGKSTLLENMAIQDIQSGEGLAFIDPHGATAEKLLQYVPPERVNDVLYFAPFDMDYPVSFNVMEDVGPDKRHLVVSGLMSTFKKIWVDAWSARMEYILSNTLLALLEYPNSTLLGVNRMLSDKAYREAVVENISDPSVRSFWVDEFAKYNERYMQEAGDAIKNKIGQFTANPLIRNIIGQPKSSFDMREIMDGRKILIMNLSKGLVGETNANLLGSMLITRIYLAAMSRADLSASQMVNMPNFYFYVDEFQSFANETFANILSEARKYKLNLTIAHQYIEQMEEEVRNAVFGNVGTIVAFRVGPFDAEVLETIFTPQFLAPDIVNLGFAQIYLTLMIDGIGSRPFSAVTMPPIEQSHISCQDQIVAASRRSFAHPRQEVEAAIHAWHAPVQKPASLTGAMHNISSNKSKEASSRKPAASSASTASRTERTESARVRETVTAKSATEHRAEYAQNNTRASTETGGLDKRSMPTREKRPQVSQQQSAPQVDDLRAVLRSIAGTETSKSTDTEKKVLTGEHSQKPSKSNHSAAKHDLKFALAQVLAQAEQSTKPSSVVPEQQSEAQKKNELEVSDVPAQTGNQTHKSGVSARQLERMLRLTGNDNPPFKR